MNRFSKDQQGSAIYWSRGATNAHEVHGGIYLKYFSLHRTSVISVFQQLTSYPRRRGATAGGTTHSRVARLTGVRMAECGLIVIRHKGFLDVLNEQTLNDWRRTSVINQLRAYLSVA
jgi:hypothetical protein